MLKKFRRRAGGAFYLRGTVAGSHVYESTGTRDARLAEALRIRRERELLERHALGAAAVLTFAEAALTYMDAGGEARYLGPLIAYFGPDKRLAEIDNAAANAAAAALYPEARPATINRQVITPISAVFNMAAANDLVPPRRFRRRPDDQPRMRWLTPEEAEALIKAADPHLLRPIGLMLGGGCRTAEALTIEASLFYPKTGEAYLPDTKNGHPRMIQIPARARELVLRLPLPTEGAICRTPKGAAYVVTGEAGGQLKGAFDKAVTAAGLEGKVTPHTLRHTWATWYYAQTADFGRLLDLGGWRKADMANRYRKVAPADLGDRLLAHGWDFRSAGRPAPWPALQMRG